MVKAAIDFSNNNSSLQKITFILHPTQAQQSIPFITSLKKCLPAGAVHSRSSSQVTSVPSHTLSDRKMSGRKASATSAVTGVTFSKVDLQQGGLLDIQVDDFISTL